MNREVKPWVAFVLGWAIAALIVFVVVPATAAPHGEQQDGCDHGATGKACVEDPSENGKDCEEHGNHGGVNENHCQSDATPTPTPTPTVIVDPTPGPSATPTASPTEPAPGAGGLATSPPKLRPVTRLARTGPFLGRLLVVGLGLLLAGSVLRLLTREKGETFHV